MNNEILVDNLICENNTVRLVFFFEWKDLRKVSGRRHYRDKLRLHIQFI